MFSLKEKIIVVTGGCGLLGKEMLPSLNENGAIAICADLAIDPNNPTHFYLDITNEESVQTLILNLIKKYGRIDGWVNNAYPRTSDWGNKLEDVTFESWRKNVDMHLNGYFLCCKYVLKQMQQQGFGSLINMSSIYGLLGPDFTVYEGTDMSNAVAYAAIKGGINNLTRYLASYYGPSQVRVNTVSPGGIFDNQNQIFVEQYCHKVPVKRMGTPKDIYAAIHFLLSDESNYITGHNLLVDGGWSII